MGQVKERTTSPDGVFPGEIKAIPFPATSPGRRFLWPGTDFSVNRMGFQEPDLPSVKAKRVKLAAGSRCEICTGEFPLSILEIHLIPGKGEREASTGPDLQREILILCPACHREIHAFHIPRADQKILVRSRPSGVRREIRRVLGYQPKPYTPPDVDLAAVYDEAHQLSSLFRVI